MTQFYYETIVVKTICKKGGKKPGACAKTNISNTADGRIKIQLIKFGKTQEDAKKKLLKLLPKGAECIGHFD